jgi:hypothetical protein
MYLIHIVHARGQRSGEVLVYPIPLQCFYRCLQVVISILVIFVSFWLKRYEALRQGTATRTARHAFNIFKRELESTKTFNNNS